MSLTPAQNKVVSRLRVTGGLVALINADLATNGKGYYHCLTPHSDGYFDVGLYVDPRTVRSLLSKGVIVASNLFPVSYVLSESL